MQKITEEAEQRRLASEYERRKNQRILREIEERELEEAKALLQEAEKRSKKKGKKPIIDGVSILCFYLCPHLQMLAHKHTHSCVEFY